MAVKVIDLGFCIAKLDNQKDVLTVVSPSVSDEHSFSPAESVVVFGVVGLKNLRDALNEAYPPAK